MRNALLVFLGFSFGSAAAEPDEIVLVPLSERVSLTGVPLIINGEPANAGEYPASFQAAISPDNVCTWFLVGPGTLVGAAHCIGSPPRNLRISAGGNSYAGRCEVSAGYATDESQDISLCQISPRYEIPRGPEIPVSGYEVLNTSSNNVSLNSIVEVSGFGCSAENAAVSSFYRYGTMRIVGLPPDARIPGSVTKTPNAIKLREAPSLLCGGDSGGPAFFYPVRGRLYRTVVGLNISTAVDIGTSYLASTSSKPILRFIEDWRTRKGEKICGLDTDAPGCRPLAP